MTLEEIKKLLATDNAILKGVLEHVLKTADGEDALKNYATPLVEKAVSDRTSEIYNGIDNDLFESLGSRKKDTQKTRDFVKELALQLKQAKESPAGDKETAEKIKDLEAKLKDAEGKAKADADWHNKYLTALTEWEKKSEEYTTQIADLNAKGIESLANVDLATGLAGLKFNPNIPQTAIDILTNKVKADILKNAKTVDGKVVYYNEDGTPKVNGLYKPATAKEILEAELKDIILVGAGGGGASKKETLGIVTTGEGDSAKKRIDLDPTKFNTKLEFSNHIEEQLLASGIEKNSTEWRELTQTAREEYGVEKMDRV